MSPILLPALAILVSHLSTVAAQGTNATCGLGYDWVCLSTPFFILFPAHLIAFPPPRCPILLVRAHVSYPPTFSSLALHQQVCCSLFEAANTYWPHVDSWVYPLSAGYHYNTPIDNSLSATPCRCNTVLYSTIQACATCQGQENYIPPYALHTMFCVSVK